jgi:hypothetical protein
MAGLTYHSARQPQLAAHNLKLDHMTAFNHKFVRKLDKGMAAKYPLHGKDVLAICGLAPKASVERWLKSVLLRVRWLTQYLYTGLPIGAV